MFKKSLKNQTVEKRLSPRKRLQTMVQVVKKESHSNEETKNHSLTGLFLKCNSPEHYTIDDQVEVSFKDETGTTQTHTGQVVRKSKDGIAIQYQKESDT